MGKVSIESLLDPVETRRGVFLGGTCNSSTWRDKLVPMLSVESYNPISSSWSMETQQQEEEAKKEAALNLYVITPKQTGFYSFAEIMANAIKEPERTVVTILDEDDGVTWDDAQKLSIDATERLITDTTGVVVNKDLESTAVAIEARIATLK